MKDFSEAAFRLYMTGAVLRPGRLSGKNHYVTQWLFRHYPKLEPL